MVAVIGLKPQPGRALVLIDKVSGNSKKADVITAIASRRVVERCDGKNPPPIVAVLAQKATVMRYWLDIHCLKTRQRTIHL